MQRILLATTLDDKATSTAMYALALAKHFGAELTVYHAFGRPTLSPGEATDEERKALVMTKLQTLMQRITGPSYAEVPVVLEADVDYAGDGILERVESERYDLLVLGLRDGAEAFTTVSFRLLKEADIDILAVPPEADFTGIHEIVFATDLDAADEVALEQLQAWRQTLSAELFVVHVYDSPEGHADAVKIMSKWDTRYADRPSMHFETFEGDFEEDVLGYAKNRGADLLVLQTKVQGVLSRLFGGGSTLEIAREDRDVPLLILRAEG